MIKTKFVVVCIILVILCMCIEEEYTPKTTSFSPTTQSKQTTTQAPQTTMPSQQVSVGSYNNILLCDKNPSLFQALSEMLRGKGYSFHTLDSKREIDAELLSEYGILLINCRDLTSSEILLIEQWINRGGSALFITSYSKRQDKNMILSSFGVQINDGYVEDSINEKRYYSSSGGYYAFFFTQNILDHPITRDIDEIQYFSNCSSLKILSASEFTAVVYGEESAYDSHYTHSPPLVAVYSSGGGRIIVSIDVFTGSGKGINTIGRGENQLFAYQMIQWLARKI